MSTSFVIDTNVFFNTEAGFNIGKNAKESILTVSDFGHRLRTCGRGELLMPPAVVAELRSFFDAQDEPLLRGLFSAVTVKAPDSRAIHVSAEVVSRLVADVRARSYRGLAIGEESIAQAAKMMAGKKDLSEKDFQIAIGPTVRAFRDRYRNATRTGFLDSTADLDLILLAKELDGFLVSSDEGVLVWGRLFGIKEAPAASWRKQIEELLHRG